MRRELTVVDCRWSFRRVRLVFFAIVLELTFFPSFEEKRRRIEDSQGGKTAAEVGILHQIQKVLVACHEVPCARRDGEVDIGFIVWIAGTGKHFGNRGDHQRLGPDVLKEGVDALGSQLTELGSQGGLVATRSTITSRSIGEKREQLTKKWGDRKMRYGERQENQSKPAFLPVLAFHFSVTPSFCQRSSLLL